MTLPIYYTLVRHGLSEANRMQKFLRDGDISALAGIIDPDFINRHDSSMRLSKEGVEQAKITGNWLRENWEQFDRFYVSPHVRTRETAAHLRLDGEWIVDDRFRERDWGEVANPTEDFKNPMSPLSIRLKEMNQWYWKPQGGESLATGVRFRAESVMDSLHRRQGIQNVVAVAHGEFINVSRLVIERLTPDAFNLMDSSGDYRVANTMVIQYTRQNPEKPTEISNSYHWRRAICPWDSSKSWNNGEWVHFNTQKHSDDDLLRYAESQGRLFSDDNS
jgi:broad specificity phosphatase PhoE